MDPSQPFIPRLDYVPYFEEQIVIQQHAIHSFKRWMVGFVVLGVLIIALAITFNQTKILTGISSQIISLGGVFISALAAFPYREITPRRVRISSLGLLKRGFEHYEKYPPDEQQKLKELAIELVRNNIK
jgi:hypothetical protein